MNDLTTIIFWIIAIHSIFGPKHHTVNMCDPNKERMHSRIPDIYFLHTIDHIPSTEYISDQYILFELLKLVQISIRELSLTAYYKIDLFFYYNNCIYHYLHTQSN